MKSSPLSSSFSEFSARTPLGSQGSGPSMPSKPALAALASVAERWAAVAPQRVEESDVHGQVSSIQVSGWSGMNWRLESLLKRRESLPLCHVLSRRKMIAPGAAQQSRHIVPSAAPNDVFVIGFCPSAAILWGLAVAGMPAVFHPFTNISMHVVNTKRIGRIRSHRRGDELSPTRRAMFIKRESWRLEPMSGHRPWRMRSPIPRGMHIPIPLLWSAGR